MRMPMKFWRNDFLLFFISFSISHFCNIQPQILWQPLPCNEHLWAYSQKKKTELQQQITDLISSDFVRNIGACLTIPIFWTCVSDCWFDVLKPDCGRTDFSGIFKSLKSQSTFYSLISLQISNHFIAFYNVVKRVQFLPNQNREFVQNIRPLSNGLHWKY